MARNSITFMCPRCQTPVTIWGNDVDADNVSAVCGSINHSREAVKMEVADGKLGPS